MLPSAHCKPQIYRGHSPVDCITLCRLLELETQLGQTAAFRRLRRVFAQLRRDTDNTNRTMNESI